ncbi:MAG: hypothetical protein ABI386_05350 [Rhodanobacter sp.]
MGERPFGHESSAVPVGRVLAALGALAVFVVVAVSVLHLVLQDDALPHHARVVAIPGMVPPTPRLQPDPDADIAAERTQKYLMLSRYAWLDSSRTFARIPIQRAMQVLVQQQAAHANSPAQAGTSAAGTTR